MIPRLDHPGILPAIQVNDPLGCNLPDVLPGAGLNRLPQLGRTHPVDQTELRGLADEPLVFVHVRVGHLAHQRGEVFIQVKAVAQLVEFVLHAAEPQPHPQLNIGQVNPDDGVPLRCPDSLLDR